VAIGDQAAAEEVASWVRKPNRWRQPAAPRGNAPREDEPIMRIPKGERRMSRELAGHGMAGPGFEATAVDRA